MLDVHKATYLEFKASACELITLKKKRGFGLLPERRPKPTINSNNTGSFISRASYL